LFTQYPFDGIDDIAFAATIWTKQTGYPIGKIKVCFVCKGFEPIYFEAFEKQVIPSFSLTQDKGDYSIGLTLIKER
jgi:hypothetical protein